MDMRKLSHRHNITNNPNHYDFESYLNTSESWDSLLLKDLALEISTYEIAQICQTDAHINMASDGSSVEEESKKTFGWIIVNNDEEILAEHAGPAFGQATLFRAEGNKGIVKRISNQLTYTHNYPFNTLEPDWDAVAQVADTLKQYNNLITITHVKGHQDDNKPLEELTMPARFNVTTDFLATNYSIQHSIQCVEVPRMEINCAQLTPRRSETL
eukprot:15366575-Ditylum_brightwellii.AAC.1